MLEQKNQALQDSLNKLNVAQMSLVESEKMASLGGLVAGVAHEINTPLGIAITAVSQLIHSTKQLAEDFVHNNITRSNFSYYTEEAMTCANMISSNLNRSADLVQSFKLVAVDQSKQNIRKYNIKEYTQEILKSLKPALKSVQGQVTLSGEDKLFLWGDPAALTQILTNLVMNSLINGFEDVEKRNIEIQITQSDENIIFHYQDSGVGIESENIEKIFEPFFTTRRGKGSSGLGMHIVFNLVTQSLKGTIKCVSKPNNGAIFIIEFPSDIRNKSTKT